MCAKIIEQPTPKHSPDLGPCFSIGVVSWVNVPCCLLAATFLAFFRFIARDSGVVVLAGRVRRNTVSGMRRTIDNDVPISLLTWFEVVSWCECVRLSATVETYWIHFFKRDWASRHLPVHVWLIVFRFLAQTS